MLCLGEVYPAFMAALRKRKRPRRLFDAALILFPLVRSRAPEQEAGAGAVQVAGKRLAR